MGVLLNVCVLLTFITAANSAAWFTIGECPDGYKAGEKWTPDGQHCMECECTDEGHGCYSCGVAFLVPKAGCYIDSTPEAPYPECCAKFHVCQGDTNFNQAKYNTYVQQLIGK